MSDIQIHYISTKTKVINALIQHYSEQGIQFIAYEPKHIQKDNPDHTQKVHYLFIIEPIEINTDSFALSSIWKTWLMAHMPQVRLFFAGFSSSQHKNYLNLLNLPDNLREWVEKTYPVNAYPLEKKGEMERNGYKYDVYEDPWERFMPLTGRSMKKQLKKFTDGHDASNSFFVQTARLRKHLVDIRFLNGHLAANILPEEDVKKDLLHAQTEVQREWSALNGRWSFYQKFFDNMPFFKTTKRIAEIMATLNADIPKIGSGELVPNLELVDELIKLVEVELNRYVNFEQHW